ncbi:hypothetical protein [Rummeliibacillus suwonensis]|uniref:hypothetical protein n=1 Tax=Rummeliibacillus suwonensis TaxID=1306154 RepID=UPI00289E72FE|nr:hypothetical protein [Rummeliibacillus suwonensis]
MNRIDFRPQDWNKAERELNGIDALKRELELHLNHSNFAAAELTAGDIILSLKRIRKLRQAKEEHDRLSELSERLVKSGISVEVVLR